MMLILECFNHNHPSLDNNMISIENIRHFIAVVNSNGVNKAAEHIFISSSSLSRSVQIIEAELNQKLFDRVGKTIQLNKHGKKFYDDSLKLLAQYENLLKGEENFENELVGNYMIGASHFLCKTILAKKISALTKKYKNASFGIFSLDSSVLVKKIHLGEIDIGFAFSPKTSESIESQILFTGEMYLCGRKKHPLMGATFNEVKKKIDQYPAIMHRPTDSIERCDNHPVFKQYGIQPQIQTYWDSDFFALETLALDDSWSLLPDIVIDSDPEVMKFQHPKNWSAPYEVKIFWNKRKSLENLKNELLESN
jgi:DNA-binding transcriptional LysR family regulator